MHASGVGAVCEEVLQPDDGGHLGLCGRADDPGCDPQTLAVVEAPLRRQRLRPGQADGQGRLSRLRHRDRPKDGRPAGLRSPPQKMGRRANLRMDDAMAAPGARL